jgi:hypothetical protein
MYINHKNKYILYIMTIIGNALAEKDKNVCNINKYFSNLYIYSII